MSTFHWFPICFAAASLTALAVPENGIPFDGHTAYGLAPKSLDLPEIELTLATWVYVTDTTESQVFLNRGKAGTGFTFYLYKGKVRMLIGHALPEYAHADADPPEAGVWTHFAGTYDGTTIRIYRNGIPVASCPAVGRISAPDERVVVGALNGYERFLKGQLQDVCIWGRCLTPEEIAAVPNGSLTPALKQDLLVEWNHQSVTEEGLVSRVREGIKAVKLGPESVLINRPAAGFRGIWYFNQESGDEYVYKYSGGLGTYCAKHIPFAWYCPDVSRTYFCYGGTDETNRTLLHMVSYYDHRTHTLAVPTILLDKETTDAHDNPVINVDDRGYIWIFSSSHGKGRPSYISRSHVPHDISLFDLVWTGNYSYPQPFFYPGFGFLFMHTWYEGGRSIYLTTSPDGVHWSPRNLLARIGQGHYQVSGPWGNRVGSAFNMHPQPKGLNWRSNLYYIQSSDFGETWENVQGEKLTLPLTEVQNPALVVDYYSQGLNVYMKDLTYDSKGNPVILYITSRGYESGPKNMPRTWTTAHWNGNEWEVRGQIVSDNNYDTGSLYLETDTRWRIIGPTEVGPQPYNPGGEVAMWLSEDAGATWCKVRQLTAGSEYNHTYVRRPVNAHPDFYALWADGHGRKPSESRLYFCTREGEVFRLPSVIEEVPVRPVPMPAVPR